MTNESILICLVQPHFDCLVLQRDEENEMWKSWDVNETRRTFICGSRDRHKTCMMSIWFQLKRRLTVLRRWLFSDCFRCCWLSLDLFWLWNKMNHWLIAFDWHCKSNRESRLLLWIHSVCMIWLKLKIVFEFGNKWMESRESKQLIENSP